MRAHPLLRGVDLPERLGTPGAPAPWSPAAGSYSGSPQIGVGEPRTCRAVAVRENGATPSGVASSRASATPPLRFGPPGDATPAAVDGAGYRRKRGFRPGTDRSEGQAEDVLRWSASGT